MIVADYPSKILSPHDHIYIDNFHIHSNIVNSLYKFYCGIQNSNKDFMKIQFDCIVHY